MWRKKIKAHPGQFVLYAVMMFLTTAIFSLSFAFMAEITEYSNSFLNKDTSSDLYLMNAGNESLADSLDDAKVRRNINKSTSFDGCLVSVPINCKGQNISMLFQSAFEVKDMSAQDQVRVVDHINGEKGPGVGEVWLPYIVTDPCGIKVGDTITLDYDNAIKLKVSGIYTAKLLSSQALGYAPIILNSSDINTLYSKEAKVKLHQIDLKDASDSSVTSLKNACKGLIFSVTRDQLRQNFAMVSNVIGYIGALAAIFVLIAVLAIIRFMIKNNIIREYRAIGTLKSLGYSNWKIRNSYLTGYMLIGVTAAAPGSVALFPCLDMLGKISTKYVGDFSLSRISFLIAFQSVGIFALIIFINVNSSLAIIKRHSAVEIMRSGKARGIGKIGKSSIKNASSPFALAFNGLMKHKKSMVLSVFAFMFSVHLAMVFIMIGSSAATMQDNYSKWFAIPSCNCYVNGVVDNKIIDYLENSDKVKDVVYGSILTSVPVKSASTDKSMSLFNFNVFSDANPAVTGVKVEDDYPHGKANIAMTRQALTYLGKSVGDTISLSINGNSERDYTIVGTFSSMSSTYGIMITYDAMREANPNYAATTAFINLTKGTGFDSFKDDIEKTHSQVIASLDWFAIDTAMSAIRTILVDISAILVGVFLIFSVVSLSIVASIDQEEKIRECGILKALGFSRRYILCKNVFSAMITSCIGIILALVLHLGLSRPILSAMMVDAFSNPPALLALYGVLEFLLVIVVAFLMNLGVSRVVPQELLREQDN